jgi:hypothetical protein
VTRAKTLYGRVWAAAVPNDGAHHMVANFVKAETGISVSEDPSFRFFLKPNTEGELSAEITDSKGTTRSESIAVGAGPPAPHEIVTARRSGLAREQ